MASSVAIDTESGLAVSAGVAGAAVLIGAEVRAMWRAGIARP